MGQTESCLPLHSVADTRVVYQFKQDGEHWTYWLAAKLDADAILAGTNCGEYPVVSRWAPHCIHRWSRSARR